MHLIPLDLSMTRAIEVAEYGWSEQMSHPDRADPPFHDLLVLLEGAWDVVCGDEFALEAGDALLLPAHHHHFGRRPRRRPTRWVYVHFTPSRGDRGGGGADASRVSVPQFVRAAGDKRIEGLLHAIVRCHWSTQPHAKLEAGLLLGELLLELSRRGSATAQRDEPVARVIRHIESDPAADEGIDDLSRVAGCSRRKITRAFRATTGQSIHQFRLGLRLRRACSLLRDQTDMPIREVAATLGFADEYHFSKAFRRHFGRPPGRWRMEGER